MGSGPVDISDPGDMTTILGTLNVDQAVSFDTTLAVTGVSTLSQTLNLGAHIVATSTTAAKNVSNTASDLYACTCMNNKRKEIDSMGEKRDRECVQLHSLSHTHAHARIHDEPAHRSWPRLRPPLRLETDRSTLGSPGVPPRWTVPWRLPRRSQ